ncbi:MAG: hypothetical protein AAF404_11865 [Pseudomonadota bacterium]
MRTLVTIALAALLHSVGAAPLLAGPAVATESQRVVQEGITVEFSVAGFDNTQNSQLLETTPAQVSFKVSDHNNVPLSGLFPAGWIHRSNEAEVGSAEACLSKTKTFIGGSLFARADLDLNVYYVLALNNDATISVVDPLFGFGGSKLLRMLPLNGVGYDWEHSAVDNRLFVSIPATDEIAEINTSDWSVAHHPLPGGWNRPAAMATHEGQRYVWVATEQGALVYDAQPLVLTQQFSTEKPITDLVFNQSGKQVYLLAGDRLTVVDTRTLAVVQALQLPTQSVTMDYSSSANELYVLHKDGAGLTTVDARSYTLGDTIDVEPGNTRIRFSPDGRWGFLVNPYASRVSIIDAAKSAVVQSSLVEKAPEYVAFSDNLAYIRHAGSANLLMVPLDDRDLGREGTEIPAIDTPGGDSPPGSTEMVSGGEGIVQAPGSNAVLVANYHDQTVYFYKEGMAAPMGQFNNFGKSPRSVLAIDHSLREHKVAGSYQAAVTLPEAGLYEAVFFMDAPRVVACFAFMVDSRTKPEINNQQIINVSADNAPLVAGKANLLNFSVTAGDNRLPVNEPFAVTVQLASGLWEEQFDVSLNEKHRIQMLFKPPMPGFYDVYITPRNRQSYKQMEVFSYEAY